MKNEMDQQQTEKNKTPLVATVIITFSITVILLVNTFCTLFICCPNIFAKSIPVMAQNKVLKKELTETEKIESSLLANGLSIIGIAVAVWASLGIANSINKKDLDKTKQDISKAQDEINKIEKIISPLNNETNEIKRARLNLFLEGLMKIPDIDIPSMYFYKKFSANSHNFSAFDRIAENLVEIEQTFYQVYTLHDSQKDSASYRNQKSDYGITLVKKAEDRLSAFDCDVNDKKLLYAYLKERHAEFVFYKGYEKSGYNNFFNVLDDYENLVEDFGCSPMPKLNSGYNVPRLCEEDETCADLKIYFANSLGEACSKIIDNYYEIIENDPSKEKELEIIGKKAIFYCKCATVWETRNFKKPEVYYRNLGCAYERWDRIFGFGTHSEEIISNYIKAFEHMLIDERPARVKRVYHALLSYYNNYINHFGELFAETMDSNRTKKLITEELLSQISNFYDYSLFAKKHLVKSNIPIVMNGFALCDIVMVKTIDKKCYNNFDTTTCMKEIQENIKLLSLLNISDDYTNELKRRYNLLSNNS